MKAAAKKNAAPPGTVDGIIEDETTINTKHNATNPGACQAIPFLKFNRTPESLEILKHPNTFALLALIAYRARRTNSLIEGLKPGEALIGDYKSCGLTEQKYRTAKKNLEKWKIITTRATNKGTIAKLINSDIFDINCELDNEPVNERVTTRQRTGNGQVTTNKNVRKKKDNNTTEEIYELYLSTIQPAQKTRPRAKTNITYHLKNHSADDLKASINNYATIALTYEPQFRKNPANFFGKLEPAFADYLPGNFEPPATGHRPVEQPPIEEDLS